MKYVIVFHVLLVSLFAPWPAWATVEISGRVLGPDGEPAAGVMVVAVMIALFTLVPAELLFNMLDRGVEAGVDIRFFRVALPFHALAHMNPDIGAELRAFV